MTPCKDIQEIHRLKMHCLGVRSPASISDTDYYTMPFVVGLAGGQEKWGGGGNQANVVVPVGAGREENDYIHNPWLCLLCPFYPHDSLHSYPLSCMQILHCICLLT